MPPCMICRICGLLCAICCSACCGVMPLFFICMIWATIGLFAVNPCMSICAMFIRRTS